MENKNILIACNSLDYILISKILDSDFNLIHVDTPISILESPQSIQFDLWLVDILFLKTDGRILEQARENHIRVIAISSEPSDARDRKLLHGGCCACYIKPIRQETLLPFVIYWSGQSF